MSLDAMDWVWNHSTARGTARLVLLAIADKAPGADCTAYAGTAMLMQRTNTTRASVRTAIAKLIKAGELAAVDESCGPNGESVYQLPLAVGHARRDSRGLRRIGTRHGLRPGADQELAPKGPEGDTTEESFIPPWGYKTSPHNAWNQKQHKEQQLRVSSASLIGSEAVRQLADALQGEALPIHWNLRAGEQQDLERLIQHHGTKQLVEVVARRAVPGDAPKPARYWLRAWSDLDVTLARPTATASTVTRHHPPRRNHADVLMAGLALLTEEGGEA
ncbi:hypothetical protein [Streptomyces sp. NPDC046685]|uniref:hypothetical protein n=1 Tax=Streptomyces sp. NPDC046685 TaxID=3157202 RepID=UPI0033FC71ED